LLVAVRAVAVLVHRAVAVLVGLAVARLRARLNVLQALGPHELVRAVLRALGALADRRPTGSRDPRIVAVAVLVGRAVAVVIGIVAARFRGRQLFRATVFHHAQHARGFPRRGAGAHSARGGLGHVVLVHRAIAVLVHHVAGEVVRGQLAGKAGVLLLAVHAGERTGRHAGAGTARGGTHDEILVGLAVAVLVHTVAGRVRGGRNSGHAGIVHLAIHAGSHPDGGASADAAGGRDGHVVVVRRAIAVVVQAVATGVGRRRAGRAVGYKHATFTSDGPVAPTLAQTAEGREAFAFHALDHDLALALGLALALRLALGLRFRLGLGFRFALALGLGLGLALGFGFRLALGFGFRLALGFGLGTSKLNGATSPPHQCDEGHEQQALKILHDVLLCRLSRALCGARRIAGTPAVLIFSLRSNTYDRILLTANIKIGFQVAGPRYFHHERSLDLQLLW